LLTEDKIVDEIKGFANLDEKAISLDEKLNELILLLNNSNIDSENVKLIKNKFNVAIDAKLSEAELIIEFQKVDENDLSRLEKLDKIEMLLKTNYIDTKTVKSFKVKRFVEMIFPVLIGIVMLTLGFAMIILPAPPYFEMFTIFHFTLNDGFTLMDLISLIIILTGIFVAIKSYFKFANQY
jgi:membrane-bound ClpP family serine protease